MNLGSMIAVIKENPEFALMKGFGRFGIVRHAVKEARSLSQWAKWTTYCNELRRQMDKSILAAFDPDQFAEVLERDGIATGLMLPKMVVDELLRVAETAPCFADRDPRYGFALSARAAAEKALGKPILLAQYFNMDKQAPVVARLRDDPFLRLVAAQYLGSLPTHISTNMWWTFPVNASEEDRIKHAHRFHNDLDDFAFMKFFFYLTDVDADDGAHVCVRGSHRSPLVKKISDNWKLRRYQDEEVQQAYSADHILHIGGPRGTGFAEDTMCIHKGATPVHQPRLVIQFQYALFDYLMQHDNVDERLLARID